ncbi:MAG: hypothetical protein OIF55_19715 [Amphritea sp.]|nr:hypothetical protein [Amphritea sp.]
MKCDVCNKEITINWGTGSSTLCEQHSLSFEDLSDGGHKNTIQEEENFLALGRGSRSIIGILSIIFGLMLIPMFFDPPRPELGFVNALPSLFCFLIAGACLASSKIRGIFGDIIALSVIAMSAVFFIAWYIEPSADEDPFGFAGFFGALAVAYLFKRYRKYFSSKTS